MAKLPLLGGLGRVRLSGVPVVAVVRDVGPPEPRPRPRPGRGRPVARPRPRPGPGGVAGVEVVAGRVAGRVGGVRAVAGRQLRGLGSLAHAGN